MNRLDIFMEFLVAGVFLCMGIKSVLTHPRRFKSLGAMSARQTLQVPDRWVLAIGLFEIAAAIALVMPVSFALPAALGLALLTLSISFVRARRHQFPAPSIVMFLLVLFVIVGRWM